MSEREVTPEMVSKTHLRAAPRIALERGLWAASPARKTATPRSATPGGRGGAGGSRSATMSTASRQASSSYSSSSSSVRRAKGSAAARRAPSVRMGRQPRDDLDDDDDVDDGVEEVAQLEAENEALRSILEELDELREAKSRWESETRLVVEQVRPYDVCTVSRLSHSPFLVPFASPCHRPSPKSGSVASRRSAIWRRCWSTLPRRRSRKRPRRRRPRASSATPRRRRACRPEEAT